MTDTDNDNEPQVPAACLALHGASFQGVLVRGRAVNTLAREVPLALASATICSGCSGVVVPQNGRDGRGVDEAITASAWASISRVTLDPRARRDATPDDIELLRATIASAKASLS